MFWNSKENLNLCETNKKPKAMCIISENDLYLESSITWYRCSSDQVCVFGRQIRLQFSLECQSNVHKPMKYDPPLRAATAHCNYHTNTFSLIVIVRPAHAWLIRTVLHILIFWIIFRTFAECYYIIHI